MSPKALTDPLLIALAGAADGETRNSLALQVADAKVRGGDEVLIRLIMRPDLANQRGTLVHALGHFDCSAHVMLLVELVASGNFEAAHEALEALETIEHVEGEDVAQAFKRLARAQREHGLEDWREAMLEDLSEMFE